METTRTTCPELEPDPGPRIQASGIYSQKFEGRTSALQGRKKGTGAKVWKSADLEFGVIGEGKLPWQSSSWKILFIGPVTQKLFLCILGAGALCDLSLGSVTGFRTCSRRYKKPLPRSSHTAGAQ